MAVTELRLARYVRALEEVGIAVHPAPDVDVSDALGQVDLCVLFEFFITAERNLARTTKETGPSVIVGTRRSQKPRSDG